ncbi:hypothetical protein BTN49_0334 (plasmid) [Candidatus Enterovibrio escicola]|uniref:Uncharacterized protein n=1 Tax=Candidatus Enterovibrio escicola TaxID=1927127 RepID=A0A2A5T767_9GAMM|nr:hypothetical protein BTN49_0334 [Candidatus Enterovibrio escacola]
MMLGFTVVFRDVFYGCTVSLSEIIKPFIGYLFCLVSF